MPRASSSLRLCGPALATRVSLAMVCLPVKFGTLAYWMRLAALTTRRASTSRTATTAASATQASSAMVASAVHALPTVTGLLYRATRCHAFSVRTPRRGLLGHTARQAAYANQATRRWRQGRKKAAIYAKQGNTRLPVELKIVWIVMVDQRIHIPE